MQISAPHRPAGLPDGLHLRVGHRVPRSSRRLQPGQSPAPSFTTTQPTGTSRARRPPPPEPGPEHILLPLHRGPTCLSLPALYPVLAWGARLWHNVYRCAMISNRKTGDRVEQAVFSPPHRPQLALDAFAVSVSSGVAVPGFGPAQALKLGVWFRGPSSLPCPGGLAAGRRGQRLCGGGGPLDRLLPLLASSEDGWRQGPGSGLRDPGAARAGRPHARAADGPGGGHQHRRPGGGRLPDVHGGGHPGRRRGSSGRWLTACRCWGDCWAGGWAASSSGGPSWRAESSSF